MPITTLMPVPKQQYFANGGIPLIGGKIYTFAAGGSTPKPTYTDSDGMIEQENPIPLNARGEPERPIYWSGSYRVEVVDELHNVVYTVDDYNTDPAGVWGAIGQILSSLADAAGSALVGFMQGGVGAVLRTSQAKHRDFVSPADFGAPLNGVDDDSPGVRKAVLYCALNGGGTVRFPDGAPHKAKMRSSVAVPGYVTIDLNNYTVEGFATGVNYVFESGYLSEGDLVSNIGTAARSHKVLNMRIINGLIINSKGIRRQDCIDGCEVNGVGFTNCTENLNDTDCFYSVNRALMGRGSSGLSELPGFKFNNNVNAQIFDSVSVVDRNIGMEFSGGINAASLRAVNSEGGRVGIRFKDQVSALNIDSGYIEAKETVGLDFTEAVGKENMTVDNMYFNGMPVAIWGNQMRSGVTIGRGIHCVNVPVWVRITDNISAATVHLKDTEDADNGLPRIRPEYELGPRINAVGRNLIYSSATGLPLGCHIVSTGIIGHHYGGKSGYSPNRVMFTTVSQAATAAPKFNLIVDTKIVFEPYVFYEFKFKVTDNDGVWTYWGEGAGSDIRMNLTPGARTAVASDVGGFLRITLGEHSHPDGTYNIEGVIRIK